MKRFGFVALVGRPNVGKSTLLNHLLGRKLSITSRKPQTTRHSLLGLMTEGDVQIAYVDTPGLHVPRERAINRFMVNQATSTLRDVDLVVLLVDARGLRDADEFALRAVARSNRPTICVINKVDLIADKPRLLPLIAELDQAGSFEAIIPISALRNEALDTLAAEIAERIPEGEHLYLEDQVTDRPAEFVIGEMIREKLMRRLGDELPHRTTVVVDRLDRTGAVADVDAVIYVERKSQKSIAIGRGGAMLKSIGEDARRDIEELLDQRAMVRLWVKVDPGWTNSARALARLGYES